MKLFGGYGTTWAVGICRPSQFAADTGALSKMVSAGIEEKRRIRHDLGCRYPPAMKLFGGYGMTWAVGICRPSQYAADTGALSKMVSAGNEALDGTLGT